MDARILIHRDTPLQVSRLQIGVTLTQVTPAELWAGSPEARELANRHVEAMRGAIYNQHVFMFGCTPNVCTSAESPRNWADLDRRMRWLLDRGVEEVMLTFWSAPDWMLIAGKHPTYKLLNPEHEQAYTELCVEALERCLAEGVPVKYLQFWNEMKGYGTWAGDWRIQDFTRAYNTWYRAIRSRHAFDTIVIGGPYMILENETADRPGPITRMNLDTLDYWYRNALGADAIAVDHGLSHGGTTILAQDAYMAQTPVFGQIARKIRTCYPGYEQWFSEHYTHTELKQYETLDVPFQAASLASILYHELLAGTSLALSWGLQGDGRFAPGGIIASWLADTRALSEQGAATATTIIPGDATPIYDVYRLFHKHFGPGTQLYYTESSDPLIEVLASEQATLVINKHPKPVYVLIGRTVYALDRYQVRLLQETTPTWEDQVREIAHVEAQREAHAAFEELKGVVAEAFATTACAIESSSPE